MTDQAKEAYQCPETGDNRHVYVWRRPRKGPPIWIGQCMICGDLITESDMSE